MNLLRGPFSLFRSKSKRPSQRHRRRRLTVQQLENRLVMSAFPVTFEVPGIVANKGVYAAVFGNATTTTTEAVTGTSVPSTLKVADTTFFPANGKVTLDDGTNSFSVNYTSIQDSTTLAGVTVDGTPTATVNSGAVVSLGNFVYLTSGSGASTTTTSTKTSDAVGPVNGNPIPVESITGFPTSGSILVSASSGGSSVVVSYTGIDTVAKSFTGTTFPAGANGIPSGAIVSLENVLGSTINVASTAGFDAQGALMIESPAGYDPNENVVVYYTGKTTTSFTGVTGFGTNTIPSGGAVIQMAEPSTSMSYALAPYGENLPLINLFPDVGTYPNTNATVSATFDLPDPATNGILSGVIVISVGTPIALPVSGSATMPSVGSPTPQTNPDDVFGLFEWGLTPSSLDFDVSEVDQVGFPFRVTSLGTDPPPPADPTLGVGLIQDRDTLFNGFTTYINSLNAASNAGIFLTGAPGNTDAPFAPGTRITAPQDIIGILEGNPPVALSALPSGSTAGPSITAYYAVTALSTSGGPGGIAGESMASNVVTGVTGTGASALQIVWDKYPYASGYNVYWASSKDGDGNLINPQLIGTTDATTLSFTDQSPSSHTGSDQTPPANNFNYDPLNRYYVPALKDFFDYYRDNRFELDDQATSTRWTGHTIDQLIGGHTYTMLQLTGGAGQWGSQFAGETLNIYLPVFSTNTDQVPANNGGITNFPPPPSWLTGTYNPWESPSAMVFGADGVFGSVTDAGSWSGATTLDVGDAKNVYNNIVSALTRGITPRQTNGTWGDILTPSNWAGSPLLTSVEASSGGSLAAGTYRYSITAVNYLPPSLSGTVTNATNANPIVITSTDHGLLTGDQITISDVVGNTAANGTFTITRLDANTFSIPVTGNGNYTSGGTWEQVQALSGTITGASQTTPIQITSANHGLQTGQRVIIADVLGNTAANGTFAVTVLNENTFSIPVASNGAYTSGGTWSQATETTPSNSIEVTVAANQQVTLTWNSINKVGGPNGSPTATGFNIYRSLYDASTQTWGDPEKLNSTPIQNGPTDPTISAVDDGSQTPNGAPPAVYFPSGSTANFYAAYFGQYEVSVNGLAYGFPFADKNGQSTNVQMAVPDGLKIFLNPWTSSTKLEVAVAPNQASTPNSPFQLSVQAKHDSGAADPNFLGTLHFTSTDPTATINGTPIANFAYTFTAADQGLKEFAVVLGTTGTHSLTITDHANDLVAIALFTVTETGEVVVDEIITPATLEQFGFAVTVLNYVASTFDFSIAETAATTAAMGPLSTSLGFTQSVASYLPSLPVEYRFYGGRPKSLDETPEDMSDEQKAEIVQQHLKAHVPIPELARQYHVHPAQIYLWIKQEGQKGNRSSQHEPHSVKQVAAPKLRFPSEFADNHQLRMHLHQKIEQVLEQVPAATEE